MWSQSAELSLKLLRKTHLSCQKHRKAVTDSVIREFLSTWRHPKLQVWSLGGSRWVLPAVGVVGGAPVTRKLLLITAWGSEEKFWCCQSHPLTSTFIKLSKLLVVTWRSMWLIYWDNWRDFEEEKKEKGEKFIDLIGGTSALHQSWSKI